MQKSPDTTRLLTVKQVCEMTGWSEASVRRKVWLRQIEYVKLDGTSIRFELSTIQRMIEQGRVPVLPNAK